MDAKFWHKKWSNHEIGFHQAQANMFLVKYFSQLSLAKGSRVLLPLCGKTLDIAWLLSRGYRVVGVELSEMAIEQLFDELGIEPVITRIGKRAHYSAQYIDMWVGDIFTISIDMLGTIDAIYDRAALVALPPEIRDRYAQYLLSHSHKAPQLLITYEYDQDKMEGPPFSIKAVEINRLYGTQYGVKSLESIEVVAGLKGNKEVKESAWLLTNE